MKQLTGWLGRGSSFLIFKSPSFVRWGLAYLLAFLWFDVLRIRRKVMLANLKIAFPEKSNRDHVSIARQSLRYQGWNLVEYSFLPWINKENVDQIFEFHGLDIIDRALAKGKGVLLLTLHLGHGDLGTAALAIKGYPVVLVSKVFKLKWLNDLWFGMREKVGVRFVPPRNSSYALLKALKKNEAVIMVNDQFTGPPIGVRTTFFGKETGTAAGLAVMSQRSGAPVVSVYIYRMENGRHAIHFAREVPSEGPVERVTQGFNDELESFVRMYPDQWMWLHKRWKRFVVQ
jgi:Kdo2-lipid IVA lauroyltransferase/acyltransferase